MRRVLFHCGFIETHVKLPGLPLHQTLCSENVSCVSGAHASSLTLCSALQRRHFVNWWSWRDGSNADRTFGIIWDATITGTFKAPFRLGHL